MSGEVEKYEVRAKDLAKQYAGFEQASDLDPVERLASLASFVPMALEVVDEARDTIQRLNEENDALKREIERMRLRSNEEAVMDAELDLITLPDKENRS